MDPVERFIANRTTGEVTLLAFFVAIMLLVSGITIGHAVAQIAG